ncbi:MAG TPA: DUF779 domain-containing protein [Flavobacteriaceae bacterium]|nr:DUF779 domain-containing protein [Flavobacteriaceae bacterium]
MEYKRLEITEKAIAILNKLKEKHGELIFHQSGGCCDGTAPMVFEKDEMYLDDSDILVGQLEGINYYMNEDQFEYWKYTYLTIDIVEGRGSSFSLEIPLGVRFIIHSRLLTDEENIALNGNSKSSLNPL